jgi:hypothetical protein
VLSFHGEGSKRGRTIYVGGLYDEARHALLESLNAGLADLGVRALDALASRHAEEIAGRSPDNITNCGRLGAGVQLEFSLGARLAFFESLTRGQTAAKGRARRASKEYRPCTWGAHSTTLAHASTGKRDFREMKKAARSGFITLRLSGSTHEKQQNQCADYQQDNKTPYEAFRGHFHRGEC